jgi:DHA3 family macrolide efflux protein-like MFS transporter
MRSALRNRAVSRLWLGQALSTIGDQIYGVGLTWLAVGLLGPDTGLLNAGEAATLMILSFIGGHWADRWKPLTTMVRVDLLRAAIALLPVAVYLFMPVPLWVLVVVALSLSGLGAFFDPALQSMLPHFAREPEELRAANGLMATTFRLARMIGPTAVGLLSSVVPMIHFFTLDAVSFVASAWAVGSIGAHVPAPAESGDPQSTFMQSVLAAFRTVKKRSDMPFLFWIKAITGSTWTLAFALGIALLVHQMAGDDARAFGFAMASYGAGNFAGALYFGNHPRPDSLGLMFTGYCCLGVGFVLVGCAPGIHWLMLAAAYTGFTGPMNDLAFSDHIQARFPVHELPRVYRLRTAIETVATLIITGVSPLIFRGLGIRGTIVACGLAWLGSGTAGFARMSKLRAA